MNRLQARCWIKEHQPRVRVIESLAWEPVPTFGRADNCSPSPARSLIRVAMLLSKLTKVVSTCRYWILSLLRAQLSQLYGRGVGYNTRFHSLSPIQDTCNLTK